MQVRSMLGKKKDQGFTLIEIMLVLAIAGLILVIVFLAVSGAQKARRDTQRKEDVARMATLLESYASNNSGNYPGSTGVAADWTTFWTNYIASSNFKSPSTGAVYTQGTMITTGSTVTSVPALDTV